MRSPRFKPLTSWSDDEPMFFFFQVIYIQRLQTRNSFQIRKTDSKSIIVATRHNITIRCLIDVYYQWIIKHQIFQLIRLNVYVFWIPLNPSFRKKD